MDIGRSGRAGGGALSPAQRICRVSDNLGVNVLSWLYGRLYRGCVNLAWSSQTSGLRGLPPHPGQRTWPHGLRPSVRAEVARFASGWGHAGVTSSAPATS
jgi:hypothetical protein